MINLDNEHARNLTVIVKKSYVPYNEDLLGLDLMSNFALSGENVTSLVLVNSKKIRGVSIPPWCKVESP